MYLSVLLLFSWVLCTEQHVIPPAPTHLLLTRVGPCQNEPHTTIMLSELGISTQTYDSSLSGTLNVTKDVKKGWKVKVTMEKCMDIRNIDTCDFMKSFYVVKNGCADEYDDEQDIYGMLFHYIEPTLGCPIIRAGTYKILNYPFFTEDNYAAVRESQLSTSIFGYIYRMHGYTKKQKKLLCLEAFLQLIYIRNHNWHNVTKQATKRGPISSNNVEDVETDDY